MFLQCLKIWRLSPRIIVIGVVCVAILVLCHVSRLPAPPTELKPPLHPPLYSAYRKAEQAFSQHNPILPIPDGGYAKFLWIPNHQTHSGWGNSLQETFLNAHLAHSAKRSFVFDDYTWDKDTEEPYSLYNDKLIPARIPLSAMISGPIIGQPLEPEVDVPRAVSKAYFDQVCPNRTLISNDDVRGHIDITDSLGIHKAWIERLKTVHDRCIEVDPHSSQIFSYWVFGSKKILELWPSLSASPIVTQFGWSPLILSAVETNKQLFHSSPSATTFDARVPIAGLLAIHVRRGDFADQCGDLAQWTSAYNGFNAFPEFPDRFIPPPPPDNTEIYMTHCYPTLERIVQRVIEVRASTHWTALKTLYIMTNGDVEWVGQLKDALGRAVRWEGISSSRDLRLDWEQKYVSHSVDMAVGQTADVFIGNGWSSLTSNVAMLRMANKFPPESTRFW